MQPLDCFGDLLQEPLPLLPSHDPAAAARWFALGMFIAFTLFELWALHTGHNTISHWLQHLAQKHHGVRWAGVAFMVWLTYHLFW